MVNSLLKSPIKKLTHWSSELKSEHSWHYYEVSSSTNDYRGQQDTLYYHPAGSNQSQQYSHDITAEQVTYRINYDWESV